MRVGDRHGGRRERDRKRVCTCCSSASATLEHGPEARTKKHYIIVILTFTGRILRSADRKAIFTLFLTVGFSASETS